MSDDLGVAAGAAGLSPAVEPASSLAGSAALIPNAWDDSFEAMLFSAHLPLRTMAFIYRDGEPRLGGGIFRITCVRAATEQDDRDFPLPPENICPLCGQQEPDA